MFLNSLPTLEISRAVPFIDIVAISYTPALATDASNSDSGRIMQMSLGQFLLGNDTVNGLDARLISAVDSAVAKDQPIVEDLSEDLNSTSNRPFGFPFSTAGMEMFTSPQTLVNAEEVHYEYDSAKDINRNVLTGDTLEDTLHPGGKRAAPVIDRFRPFMSLSELKVNVAPRPGMASYKSAELRLVLHDRSRLAEVAALVKPDALMRTHLLLEYGWAHPDNKVHSFRPLGNAINMSSLRSDPNANLLGQFISAMRCREKYKIVNSSFSFDDTGQVTINLQIAMLGSEELFDTRIGFGGEVESQVKAISRLTQAISEIRRKMTESEGSEDVLGDGNVLNVASSTSTAINISAENIRSIDAFLRANKGNKEIQELPLLEKTFRELVGNKGGGRTGGAVGSLKKSIASVISSKLSSLGKTEDPWARSLNTKSLVIDSGSKRFVSLAKIFTMFVGAPLTACGKFDEIQMYFYAFNDKASFARDINIAQFPIDIEEFRTGLESEMKLEPNLPINRFLNFINKMFILDQGSPAYGMTSLYSKTRDMKEDGKRKIVAKFENESAMMAEKQRILSDAYGPGEKLSFKLPSLKMKMETVAMADRTAGAGGKDEPGAEKTILRVHVFDEQATSFTCLRELLESSRRDKIGVLTKSAGNVINREDANSEHGKEFNFQLVQAINFGLLEPIPVNAVAKLDGVSVESLGSTARFRLKGGLPALKNFLSRSMPTIRYGSQNSAVLKANVQSMNNPPLSTINLQRQGLSQDEPQGKRDSGVPMTVHPIECNLETIGCPLWEFGQQFFLDFGTGTTVDNVYAVFGIDHVITPGSFKTSLKMRQLQFGVYDSMIDKVAEAASVLADNAAG